VEFYKILEGIMRERDLTVADIARISGLPDSTVRMVVTRKQKRVALDVAMKLSKGLKVSLEFLNEGEAPTGNSGLTPREQSLLDAYRASDVKVAVDRLLGVEGKVSE